MFDPPYTRKSLRAALIWLGFCWVLALGLWLLFPRHPGGAIGLTVMPPIFLGAIIVLRAVGKAIRSREHVPAWLLALEIAVLIAIPVAILVVVTILAIGPSLQIYTFFVPAGYLIGMGRYRRVGTTRHCAKCEYEFNYDTLDEAPARCPECGHIWITDLAVGRRVGSRPRFIAGIVVLVGGFVGPLLSIFAQGWIGGLMPTSALIQMAGRAPRESRESWAALKARVLTREQRLELAQLVLDHRAGGRQWYEAGDFLESVYNAGLMPATMRERYFNEMFTVNLSAPTTARVGEAFEARLIEGMAWDTVRHKVQVYFAGFGLDDAPLIGRRASTDAGSLIAVDDVTSDARDRPTARLIAEIPGSHIVKAVMWVTVDTKFNGVITWNPDGTPVLPPTVLWSKRLELTQPITITP